MRSSNPRFDAFTFRPGTLALVAAAMCVLAVGLLLAMSAAIGIALWPIKLPTGMGAWLAAIGAPSVLIGLLIGNRCHEAHLDEVQAPAAKPAPLRPEVPPLALEEALRRIANGDLDTPVDVAGWPAAWRTTATLLETARQRVFAAQRDIECAVDGATRGDAEARPDVTQPGRYGRTAMKLELLLEDRRLDTELARRIETAASRGNFAMEDGDTRLAATPVARAALALLATTRHASEKIVRLSHPLNDARPHAAP